VLDCLRLGEPRSGVHARTCCAGCGGDRRVRECAGACESGRDTVFECRLRRNCLVNVMAVGWPAERACPQPRCRKAARRGCTCSWASPRTRAASGRGVRPGELGAEDQRGAVQLPDPFLKRVLNVATYAAFELIRRRRIPVRLEGPGRGRQSPAPRASWPLPAACGAEIAAGSRASRGTGTPARGAAVRRDPGALLRVVPRSSPRLCALYEREFALGEVHPVRPHASSARHCGAPLRGHLERGDAGGLPPRTRSDARRVERPATRARGPGRPSAGGARPTRSCAAKSAVISLGACT